MAYHNRIERERRDHKLSEKENKGHSRKLLNAGGKEEGCCLQLLKRRKEEGRKKRKE